MRCAVSANSVIELRLPADASDAEEPKSAPAPVPAVKKPVKSSKWADEDEESSGPAVRCSIHLWRFNG